MLAEQGIISVSEADDIVGGLRIIAVEIESGTFSDDLACEDIHMNIEKRLFEIIGPVAGKLHTGRSRNDQVALDMHLYLREELAHIDQLLKKLQVTIIDLARENEDLIVPGYTHLQRAQPLLLAHHLLAYFWMLGRDRERIKSVAKGIDLMPLGAGALAGTGFPVNRELVAEKLGFSALYENSIDAVSDRDYLIEFLAFASILIMHLSRFSEELILWNSSEFGFIEIDDAYTTGSSMMPQKKNPDVAELVRGKTGRIYGALFAMLTMMKGIPLAYNKDMQEDKEGLFDVVDQLKVILPIFAGMLQTMTIKKERLLNAIDDDYLCATDIADYLASKGVAFRDAHHIVGEMIAYTNRASKRLRELNDQERSSFHPFLAVKIDELYNPARVVEARKSRGGTSPTAVKLQIEKAVKSLSA